MHGLLGSSITYRIAAGAEIRVTVRNVSSRDGDEVVQLYLASGTGKGDPIRSLRGFQRIHLRAGERREVSFTLDEDELPAHAAEISVGGGQPLGSTPRAEGTIAGHPC